jgi:hypothetical protein
VVKTASQEGDKSTSLEGNKAGEGNVTFDNVAETETAREAEAPSAPAAEVAPSTVAARKGTIIASVNFDDDEDVID